MSLESQTARVTVSGQKRPFPERLLLFVADNWLLLLNLAVFIYVALPVLAPVLAEAGFTRPALWIYSAYRVTCHQLPYRSFFLGGPEFDYSVAQIEEVTGTNSPYALMHRPLVDSVLGSQTAFCHRDLAIYGAVLLSGIVFGLVRGRGIRPLPFKIFLLFLVPLAIDGLTQILGGIVPFMPPRESTWLLRTITGVLFGIGGVWLAYPYIDEGMRDVQRSLR